MGNLLNRQYQNKGGHELKEVVRKAILHMDEHNVFWCNQFSRMHANVWLVCMMSVATAVYAIFSVFMVVRLIFTPTSRSSRKISTRQTLDV